MCLDAFTDCNGRPDDGCEVDLTTDLANCGACSKACGAIAHGKPACKAGMCAVGSCDAGFADCNNSPGDGCETNLNTDLRNCSLCGKVCPIPANAMPTCAAGRCGITCNNGFADCNNMQGDGCEINTQNDVRNCNSCGVICTAANGVAGCANGSCTVALCNPGFGDCDRMPGNGCETNTSTSNANCGLCGRACAGNQVCVSGVCKTFFDLGPNHSFTGLTSSHYITQGCCSINNCMATIDQNAQYFCDHFYAQPMGLTCTPVAGYRLATLVNCGDAKMHKNGGCTSNGNNIPNTTCDAGACKIGNWVECTSGITNLVCHCL
jgi:hypothetical protein